MFSTATAPIIPLNLAPALTGLQYIVATTTIWSGLSYVFSKDAYRVVAKTRKTGPPPPPVA
jgi:cardiolipin synthase (CMP-forming)